MDNNSTSVVNFIIIGVIAFASLFSMTMFLLFFINDFQNYLLGSKVDSFVSTSGSITQGYIKEKNAPSGAPSGGSVGTSSISQHYPEFTVTYIVDGKKYTTSTGEFMGSYGNFEGAYNKLQTYAPNSVFKYEHYFNESIEFFDALFLRKLTSLPSKDEHTMEVTYNPKNPETTSFQHIPNSSWLGSIIGGLFTVIMLMTTFFISKGLKFSHIHTSIVFIIIIIVSLAISQALINLRKKAGSGTPYFSITVDQNFTFSQIENYLDEEVQASLKREGL